LVRRLKNKKVPEEIEVIEFILYMFQSMYVSSPAAKSVSIIALIYLERIIQDT